MNNRYYASGKLLISGEYLVSRGSNALAVPLKLGQRLEVVTRHNPYSPCINWRARVLEEDWFKAVIRLPEMEITLSTDEEIARRLVKILEAIRTLNEGLIIRGFDYDITTQSMFSNSWGLGSSSALIANLSQWAQINPFDLFFSISSGSGCDVATALARGPIIYNMVNRRVQISPVKFFPPFRHHIWFAYQGQKQDTAKSLDYFNQHIETTNRDIEKVNGITLKLIQTDSLVDFMENMQEHELLLSRLLNKLPVKAENFTDFKGEIKSLGAWGGDFIMIASDQPPDYIRSYFAYKGIQTLFGFEELILN